MRRKDHIQLKDQNSPGDGVTAVDEELTFTPSRQMDDVDTTIYKVYKRRWIGVVIIMLLNIVSAWRLYCSISVV